MRIQQIGDDLRRLLAQNEAASFLARYCDYGAYGLTAVLAIGQFVPVGSFAQAFVPYLTVLLAAVTFACRRYVALAVLLIGRAFSFGYPLLMLPLSGGMGAIDSADFWADIVGLVVYGLLAGGALLLLRRQTAGQSPKVSPHSAAEEPSMQAKSPVQNRQEGPELDPVWLGGKPQRQVCPGCGASCPVSACYCPRCGKALSPGDSPAILNETTKHKPREDTP
ncbi:MAG TPA: zinc ribbon domain-containing protein [Candidatus Gallacutalibacter stercoravium]|nr:zinc ribbon domain-containing protein [Candidatus Gallacutalibacter stercoravium]